MAGNAVAYFSALAYCTSMIHCRNRIAKGMARSQGIMALREQSLTLLLVRIAQKAMYSSDRGRAYDVNASASKMSPNFPSSVLANPPIDTLRSVCNSRDRPLEGKKVVIRVAREGTMKRARMKKKVTLGSKVPALAASPCEIVQNSSTELASGTDKAVAKRKTEM